jgi:pilus assembly protein Flp/PilA
MSSTPATRSRTTLRSTMALFRARIARDERGATAIEYALIAAGIGVAIAATVTGLGSVVKGLYDAVAAAF